MAHQYSNVVIHLIFSTKERLNLIPEELRSKLWKYLAGIGHNYSMTMLASGGTGNHAHVLIVLPANMTVAKACQVLKANSSRWMGQHGIKFAWQEGYGAFSVSASNVATVRDYIEHQAEHHAKRSYEDEFKAFLRKTGTKYQAQEIFG